MANNTEKTLIRKALESISNGNATALKKNIKEALLYKVRRALNAREKELAKTIVSSTISEAFVPTQTDKQVITLTKRILKTSDVTVVYNNTEYLARIPSSNGKLQHLGIILEPSDSRLGKMNWVVYDQSISDQDPSSKQKLAAKIASVPFDQGDIATSIRKLQELLARAAKTVVSGGYAAQEPSF